MRPFIQLLLSRSARIPTSRSNQLFSTLPQHRETPYNNLKTPWQWTEESKKEIAATLSKYPANYRASATIPLLWIAQRQNDNWIPLVAMIEIARIVGVPASRVFETCTFYTMFNRAPIGKYHIQLCGTTPCMNCGAESIADAIRDELGISSGETTADGQFTMTEVECLGACVNAPMVQLNDDYIEDLTPATMKQVICDLKAGKPYQIGPQNGRQGCMGPQGKTSLFAPPPGPFCRDLTEAKAKHAEAKAAAAAAAKK